MFKSYSNLPTAIWLIAAMTLINRCGSMVFVFLPIYLAQRLNLDMTTIGIILSMYGLGEVIGSYIGGVIIDHIDGTKVQANFLVLMGLLYFAQGQASNIYLLCGITFLIGLMTAGLRPANGANLVKFSSPENLSRAYALNYQGANLGFCIGSVVGGILATYHYSLLFIIDGSTSILAGIVFWFTFHNRVPLVDHLDTNITRSTQSVWRHPLFLCVLLFILLTGMCFFLTNNIYPVFLKETYHLSEHQIGLVFGINGLMIILFQMPLTTHLRQYRPLTLIGLGSLLTGLGFIILPLMANLTNAAFSMILITMGEMISMPVVFSYVTSLAPPGQRGKYLGLCSAAMMSLPLTLTP